MYDVGLEWGGRTPSLCPDGHSPGLPSSLLSSLAWPPTVLLPMAALAKLVNDKSNPIPFGSKPLSWLSVALRPKPTVLATVQSTQSDLASVASAPGLFAPVSVLCLVVLQGLWTRSSSTWNSLPVSALGSQFREAPLAPAFWLVGLPHYVNPALAWMSLSKLGTD